MTGIGQHQLIAIAVACASAFVLGFLAGKAWALRSALRTLGTALYLVAVDRELNRGQKAAVLGSLAAVRDTLLGQKT